VPGRPGRERPLSRTASARALAGFLPDCARLFARLARDEAIPRRRRLLLAAAVGYLALPFDLVPDFLPVVGLLDDALLVAVLLRHVLRTAGPDVIARHWPGPEPSLRVVLRLAGRS